MNQLLHCGDALNTMLKDWKASSVPDTVLLIVENAVQSLLGTKLLITLGTDIVIHGVYKSFIDDANNTGFKSRSIPSFEKKQSPFPFYGTCFLVAFRNCAVHSGLEIAYGYFPGKDADIINLARKIRDCGGLPHITCYLHYLWILINIISWAFLYLVFGTKSFDHLFSTIILFFTG